MNGREIIPSNLAYLLWRQKVEPERWTLILSQWAGCDVSRASEMLAGQVRPSDSEVTLISANAGVDSSDFYFSDLLEGVDLFLENLRFLLDSLEHGGQARLAELLEVKPATVYKWKCGEQRPSSKHVLALLEFFGLPPSTDMDRIPLFLSIEPVGARKKREWLVKTIQQMDIQKLGMYYPALRKLLG